MTDSAPEIHVLMLTDSPETAQLVPALLEQAEGLKVHTSRATGGEALTALARYRPHVIVLADTLESPPTIIAALDATAPEIPQLVILSEGDVAGIEACGLAGARATLLKPFEEQRLVGAIQLVHSRELRHRQHVGTPEAGAPRLQRPRVVAVHGAKGGVGTTTIACNLAAMLHHLTGRRVAMVDGDLLSGDVGVLYDLAATRTLGELLPELQELDLESVDSYFVQHSSGVHVLLAPDQLQRAEGIKAQDVQRALSALRPYFDYQIVDTSSQFLPATLAVMDEADLIILVVTPELAALRSAARFLRLAAQLGIPNEKLLLVANRANAGRQITTGVLEEQLLRPVAVAIPHDGRAPVECMNAGDLLAAAYPRSRVAEGLQVLARQVAGRAGTAQQPAVPAPARPGRPSPAGGSLWQRLARRWTSTGWGAPRPGGAPLSDQVPAS